MSAASATLSLTSIVPAGYELSVIRADSDGESSEPLDGMDEAPAE
jgi:hypothetical protein